MKSSNSDLNRYRSKHWLDTYRRAWGRLTHSVSARISASASADIPGDISQTLFPDIPDINHPLGEPKIKPTARPTSTPTSIPSSTPTSTPSPTPTATSTSSPTPSPTPSSTPSPTPASTLNPESITPHRIRPDLSISPEITRPIGPDRYGIRTREVVLTFDDGPHLEQTPKILEILARYNIKAVFFVVGYLLAIDEYFAIAEQAVKQGHIVGNHTYSHANLTTLSDEDIRWELNQTQSLIGDYAHEKKPFRPPYGAIDQRVIDIAEAEGYNIVMWNVDTRDWQLRENGAWIPSTIRDIMPLEHSLLVMHDSKATTADYLEQLILSIKATQNTHFTPLFT